jgi:hypothetical protein
MGKGRRTKLEKSPTSPPYNVVSSERETNISTFNGGQGFTFSLRELYYLGSEDPSPAQASRKLRQGDSLIISLSLEK